MASTEKSTRKDKNQNIQVFVRLRPLNQRERAIRSLGVVEVVNSREVVVRQSPQTSHTKRFTFDRAFGPNVEQVEVYKEVVSPLIAEVLAGYNCTVFAYGQTGTGKTHTMVGESSGEGTTWQNDPLAGIIPRALSQLFDELRISNAEYTVRVSYLELYNEELFDLLSSSDDNSKLRIYEDITRKGSTIVNGLEEITVYNKNEVYEIMAQGQERKRVASTLMNAQSSRSHTVFTIVVHMKENCPKGEELVKIGKLNLVDLAGSENISKAGSDNPAKRERARECVNINQSLLTLGRVITALVEKHPHIPYRESKLTRILQESLGGRTKTSIIATVSPGHKDLEETMSTLEYANRAKNIQNKPEVNQKLTKQAILKEFAEEVDKLKRELTAAREKNGVYLPSETYVEMTLKHDEQRREIQELLLKKRAMEDERARAEAVFDELRQRAARTADALAAARDQLDTTQAKLSETSQQCAEQQHLVLAHAQSEEQLLRQARALLATADAAAGDAARLHDTVTRRKTVESTNQEVVKSYREESTAQRQAMLSGVQRFSDEHAGARDRLQAAIDDHARDTSLTQELNIQDTKLLVAKMGMLMNEIKSLTVETESQLTVATTDCKSQLESQAAARRDALQALLGDLVASVAAGVRHAAAADVVGTVARCTDQWLTDASGRVASVRGVCAAQAEAARAAAERRAHAARAQHRRRRAALHARHLSIDTSIAQIEKDKNAIEQRMTQQLAVIESERDETERRLSEWMEQERRSLEERMERHVATERGAADARLAACVAQLDQQRALLAESSARLTQLQQMQLDVNKEEEELEDEFVEQCENETGECLKVVDEFEKDFGDGTSAVGAELEAFTHSVAQVVRHAGDQLLGQLQHAHDSVQTAAAEVQARDAEAAQHAAQRAAAALAGVADAARHALERLAHKSEEDTTSTIETLTAVAERSSVLAQTSLAHQETQSSVLARATQHAETLVSDLREQLAQHAAAEGRYLMHEYRVYEPSGSTPARCEYRYPRRLAATSPHDRILQRFRDAQRARSPTPEGNGVSPRSTRKNNVQQTGRAVDSRLPRPVKDFIVIESDEGRHTSDSDDVSESSVSEDSAVAMQ